MLSQPISVTFDIGEGRTVSIETGKLARQANGAVTVRQGNCIILATVVANKEAKEGQDFFPLSVDYRRNSLQPAVSRALFSKEKPGSMIMKS